MVPGGAGRAGWIRRLVSASGSGRASGAEGELPPNELAVDLRRLGLDARRRRRVVPAPVRPRAARPQLGAPGGLGRARGHPALLVRPRRRRRAHRLGGAAASRIPSSPRSGRTPAPASIRSPTATSCTTIYRRWRAIADSYEEPRVLVGEVWLPDAERFARYLRPDELHTAFNFDFLACPWEPGPMRTSIESALAAHAPVDAPATWVLSNHDVTRPVTRYGRADTGFAFETKRAGTPTDLARGRGALAPPRCSRWRCPARCTSTRAKSSGCRRWRTSRPRRRQDPMWQRSGGVDPGRDGCRDRRSRGPVRSRPTASARTTSARLWLDQPDDWAPLSVEAQTDGPGVDAQPLPRRAAYPPPGAVGCRAPSCAGSTTAMT